MILNKIKEALGLDKALMLVFGAAPLASDIRQYFLTLGFPLLNVYGMSENGGPETTTDLNFMNIDKEFMREAGTAYPGTELKIVPLNPGEVEGNNVLMKAKYVTEDETFSWATSRVQRKRRRLSMLMGSSILETSVVLTPTGCCSSQAE